MGCQGGQAHRLAIAQLLLQDAKVWLLDEPTEHLDSETAFMIKDLLKRLSVHRTVIWITHDQSVDIAFDDIHHLGGL